MPATTEQLKDEYYGLAPLAERFNERLRDELEQLLSTNKISLGVPIEFRVKKLDSFIEKIERQTLSLESVTDLWDLIGLRVILLFSRDVVKTCELISKTFNVLYKEDTQERLGDSQFGYQSFHYCIQVPENWLSVPTFAPLGKFKAEIQIRTVAQHMWAAASHVLQYKQESNVPLPVRRSIYRVSAILETVDLEFERVLDARESYISNIKPGDANELLNVDSLARAMDSLLPAANKDESEPYSDLLPELLDFGIDSTQKLKELLQPHLKQILKDDADAVKVFSKRPESLTPNSAARLDKGVFFPHVGLIRRALRMTFGERYSKYWEARIKKREQAQAKPKRTTKRRRATTGSAKKR